MRVFVSEYVCGGGMTDRPPVPSLAAEGRAMLVAAVEDFARIPDCRVSTTWDSRIAPPAFAAGRVSTVLVSDPEDERRRFDAFAAECDATFVIAPEFAGILLDRSRRTQRFGRRWLGCSADAIELCADKLRLATHLTRHGIPTIETATLDPCGEEPALPFPLVVKPRDGAGSLNTCLVRDRSEWNRVRSAELLSGDLPPGICQPFVPGRAVSVAVLIAADGKRLELLPPAQQQLGDDGRFCYFGGRVPDDAVDARAVHDVVQRACGAILGLRGYVGFDLIVPAADPEKPVVVEINPRLTTSFIGYRALTAENLAERILFPDRFPQPIVWRRGSVAFQADGLLRTHMA